MLPCFFTNEKLYFIIYTLSNLENGCDVTAYFVLGKTETRMMLSVCRKIHEQLQKNVVETLARMEKRVTTSRPGLELH